MSALHKSYNVPHVIITSVRLPLNCSSLDLSSTLSVIGSSATTAHEPRLFYLTVPALPCFFSGAGDMFAGLTLVRFREACLQAGLLERKSWMSSDEVGASELPLALACEKVLSSMQLVLEKTLKARDEALKMYDVEEDGKKGSVGAGVEGVCGQDSEAKKRYLAETKAAEVRVVRNVADLRDADVKFRAKALEP
jgi:pyridoxine kinase